MFNKFLIFGAVLVAVAVAAEVAPEDFEEVPPFEIIFNGTDLFIGKRTSDDYQLTQFGVWGAAVDGEVVTKTLQSPTAYEITFIHAYDMTPGKSSGAIPSFVSGGPGTKLVDLLFTSQPGGEIYYWVDVFARRS